MKAVRTEEHAVERMKISGEMQDSAPFQRNTEVSQRPNEKKKSTEK